MNIPKMNQTRKACSTEAAAAASTTEEVVSAVQTKIERLAALRVCFEPCTVVGFGPPDTCLGLRHIAYYPCLGMACLVAVALHLAGVGARLGTGIGEAPGIAWYSCYSRYDAEFACSATTWPGWADNCNHRGRLGSCYRRL